MNLLKIISFATLFTSWLDSASADGKITAQEVIDLLLKAIKESGIDLYLDIQDED